MFESIRKHSKFVMILLFLLIIPSFIFVGVNQNYFTESSQTVARVDGHDITQQDWDNAHRAESDRLRAQNPTMDAKLLDSPEARYATLEKLVRDRVLAAAAAKMHLTTPDAQLVRTLREIPAIASLQKPDGSLDAEAYKALVGSQGMTPEGFEANLRRELALNQVLGSVSSTSFTTAAQLQQAMDALYQRREIQVARFDASALSGKVQPTEAELKAFYESHTSQFKQPEAATGNMCWIWRCRERHCSERRRSAHLLQGKRPVLLARRASCQPHPDQCGQGSSGCRA
jgi:peptidyl-prolyl cis-trans isomerase D